MKERKLPCHPLVAETAREMAAALYEEEAKNNDWFALNPDQEQFVSLTAPRLLEQARATLAQMLGGTSDEVLKKEIYQALVMDNTLRRPTRRELFRA